MRRMKKSFLALLLAASLVIMSCGGQKAPESSETVAGPYVPGQMATAYGFNHGDYIAMAKVTTTDEGFLNVYIDEAFLPITLATVKLENGWNENNTVKYVSHGEANAAKYVEYNGKTYVAVPVGTTLTYVEADEKGEPVGNVELDLQILRDQSSMAAYFALIQSGSFKVFKEFGGEAVPVTTTVYGGLTKKNAPGYWGGDSKTTWMSNIKAIEEFIEKNGVQFEDSDFVKSDKADANGLKMWSVADAVTGATNSDFKGYFGVVQYAAGKLKTN